MAGPDRARLPRDGLGLGLSEMLQTQANLPFRPLHEGQRGEGVGMGSNASGVSITRLLRVADQAAPARGLTTLVNRRNPSRRTSQG